MPIEEATYISYDTELTGLDFKKDSIISIGAVKMKGSRIYTGKTLYRLVQPDSELKHDGVTVHEITHTDLKEAEELEQVIDDFLAFIGDAVLIGHFVHIDIHFVNKALKKMRGTKLKNLAIDTHEMHNWLYENDSHFARHHQGMTTQNDLFSLARRYGIEVRKAHNAFYDAFITAQLFQRFFPFLKECGIQNVNELVTIGKP